VEDLVAHADRRHQKRKLETVKDIEDILVAMKSTTTNDRLTAFDPGQPG